MICVLCKTLQMGNIHVEKDCKVNLNREGWVVVYTYAAIYVFEIKLINSKYVFSLG